MSHFSVIVRLPGSVAESDIPVALAKMLAPFHEFECTGTDDEFVQDIDETAKVREEYEESTESRYKDPSGALHEPYADAFYREPTPEELKSIGPIAGSGCGGGMSWTSKDWGDGLGYRTKIHFKPEGWEDVRVDSSEVTTFAGYIKDSYGREAVPFGEQPDLSGPHKYGYALLGADGEVTKVVDRTNPNKRWDWYTIGGRWSGYFPVKVRREPSSPSALKANLDAVESKLKVTTDFGERWVLIDLERRIRAAMFEEARVAQPGIRLGRAGTFGNVPELGHGDIVRKDEIDFDLVATKTREAIEKFHGEWERFLAGEKFDAFEGPRSRAMDIGLLQVRKELKPGDEAHVVRSWALEVQPGDDRASWSDVCRRVTLEDLFENYAHAFSPISGYAYLDETGWHEPGRMGWFGCSSDTPETLMANKQDFMTWLKATPDDAWLAAVDCHI